MTTYLQYHVLAADSASQVAGKDVIIAVFAGAIGIAGLILVFEGFLLAAYSILQATASDTRRKLRHAIIASLCALVLAIVAVGVNLLWLLAHDSHDSFDWAVGLFVASLVSVPCLGIFATVRLTR